MERFMVSFNGKSYEVEVERLAGTTPQPPRATSMSAPVSSAPPAPVPAVKAASTSAKTEIAVGQNTVCAPMPGKILAVHVKTGECVKRGDTLLILEAMKMQNEIMAPADGKVTDIRVGVGQSVASGDTMIVLS